ncbi:MAG: phosphotransferase family protein [Kutzneria sp.]|nr:phosphotransferase family protein [Kutzneria sp.]MBV9844248.1 phosphotransferase family protein [Kutzneria sp.]
MTDPPGLSLEKLTQYLDTVRPGLRTGRLTADLIPGGRSNLTYRLTDGTTQWVLRRPPLDHVLATAHDMSREYRVINALAPTAVPVPATELLCTDTAVIGVPFYLMDRVAGSAMRSQADTSVLSADQATRVAHLLVDVLADLHDVVPETVGLGDLGQPTGFMARQVARWRKQLNASRSRDLPGIDHLHDRLAASVPHSSRTSIVHGDYKLDNVLVTTDPLGISAVLDWEMATLGDPLADLGLLVAYWQGVGREDDPITGGVTRTPGFPPISTLIARYAQRTGADLSHLGWYVAFAYFKVAVILEGIHYRFARGGTVGTGFDQIGGLVLPLVERGIAAVNALPAADQEQ